MNSMDHMCISGNESEGFKSELQNPQIVYIIGFIYIFTSPKIRKLCHDMLQSSTDEVSIESGGCIFSKGCGNQGCK